ncbi:MAG: hypothetical protein SNJ72_07815, partial [Fimbriimonadales bacterium]
LSTAIQRFAHANLPTGMTFLITDGLDETLPDALRTLGSRRHELVVLQLLSEVELEPDLEGDLRLIDSETGEAIEITATRTLLTEYHNRLKAHLEAIQTSCRRVGALYRQVRNTQSPQDILLRVLYPLGVLQG